MRSTKILKKENTALIIIDIQEKLLNVMKDKEKIVSNTVKLIKGCKILNIPIYFTEQYPKGIGPTHKEILDLLENSKRYEKDAFSIIFVQELIKELRDENVSNLILCGIESHVCVMQSALDLDSAGFHVYVIGNAISSRKEEDYLFAIRRFVTSNIQVITYEMALFEMLERSGTEAFKQISSIIK